MNDYDLINELAATTAKLDEAVRLMAKYGREFAQADHDYKVLLAQQMLVLKSQGMSVTLIEKVVFNIKEVADARLKRDIAETMYDSAKENINKLKLQARLLDNQIGREWTQSGGTI